MYVFYLARRLEWGGREQASFCQAGHGRLAVLLQAVPERMKLSFVEPASVIHICPIHIYRGKIIHLSVSTVSVC